MLDVHVPYPTHTWKDFFIHIATIVAALIAVALAAHTALARGA
jgi:GAF domain-containing protein